MDPDGRDGRGRDQTELSASPSTSQESLRRLPWCTCVSASARRSQRGIRKLSPWWRGVYFISPLSKREKSAKRPIRYAAVAPLFEGALARSGRDDYTVPTARGPLGARLRGRGKAL